MKLSEWLTPGELKKAKELVQKGEDIMDSDPKLFDKLYEYYAFEVNEMPYGTMKARDGDPAEWISERLEKEFKSSGSMNDKPIKVANYEGHKIEIWDISAASEHDFIAWIDGDPNPETKSSAVGTSINMAMRIIDKM